jgi:hypothetical protein
VMPGNLPLQPTSFAGRSDDIRNVSEAIYKARLVTVTGTGKVPKARAALLLSHFHDLSRSRGRAQRSEAATGRIQRDAPSDRQS